LERPYHLSYPFVFEYQGEFYMIPETYFAERVELYRATEFPYRWELIQVLQDKVAAADTTLWMEDGIFYFFTSIAEKGLTENDNLYLFYSDELTGCWRPHPGNPVCQDVRRSRSAGHLFRRNGSLIRPAQDCSVRYGYACQLNRVECLSPRDFKEAPFERIEPAWHHGLIGTHTINSSEYVEVIDGQIYRSKYSGIRAKIHLALVDIFGSD
jgi:hypothetical protein